MEWLNGYRRTMEKPWNLPIHHTVDELGVVTFSLGLTVQADLRKVTLADAELHAQVLFKEAILECAR
jgi:hypothetical protein